MIFEKILSLLILYQLTKFQCLISLTSWDLLRFIIFKGLPMKEIKKIFFESQSPALIQKIKDFKELINIIKSVSEKRTWKIPVKDFNISKVRYSTKYKVYKLYSIKSMFCKCCMFQNQFIGRIKCYLFVLP